MDLYSIIVLLGSCIGFYAMYRVLTWFINRPYKTPKKPLQHPEAALTIDKSGLVTKITMVEL